MSHNLQLPHASSPAKPDFRPMFTRIPDAVLLDSSLTPIQFRIYAVIARRADRETASAFPSYVTIARDANISRTSAINGVTALVASGYLTKRTQESGQGDATSNLYKISGEGSAIFAPRRVDSDMPVREAVQNLHHGSAANAPQVVQDLHHGSANAAPELDSVNKKKSNKIQENRIAPAHTHEVSAAAAADPELAKLFSDFQENIGALTAVARKVIEELVSEFGIEQVRDAIDEAVIYEKRSLGYIRRVLSAWKNRGRGRQQKQSTENDGSKHNEFFSTFPENPNLTWPPVDIQVDQNLPSQPEDLAAEAWRTISQQLPELNHLMSCITPQSLVDKILTLTVADAYTYAVLTCGHNDNVNFAARAVMGIEASIQIEMTQRDTAAVLLAV